jgi:hypothetical protein
MELCLLGLLLVMPSQVFACRCAGPMSPQTAYRRADTVVVARVMTVTPNPDNNGTLATVRVSQAWKGEVPRELTVATDGTCAYRFASGQEDLLYLSRTSWGGYGATRCNGTQPLAKARKALGWLHRYGSAAKLLPDSRPALLGGSDGS